MQVECRRLSVQVDMSQYSKLFVEFELGKSYIYWDLEVFVGVGQANMCIIRSGAPAA